MIPRDRDANTSWVSASDGTLEERRYYCQNWRADVSVIITSGGVMVEWAKYSPYGIPFGLPGADTDSDGDCDATDITNFDSVPSYDVRYDIDLDGDNDATDKSIAQTYYQGATLGWDTLSTNADTGTGNRKGYAGYEYHEAVSLYHIRNRVLHPELGRWTKRDPLGYVDGMSVYEYVGGRVIVSSDPTGTDIWTDNKFNAYIGSTHANLPGGWMGPIIFPWLGYDYVEMHVRTDNRIAGAAGTSRINTVFDLDTDKIGSVAAIYNIRDWSDKTYIRLRGHINGLHTSWQEEDKTSIPTVTWSRKRANCVSEVNIVASGIFPFTPKFVTPAVDFDVTWVFQMYGILIGNYCFCEVAARVRGTHDSYPDYEGIVNNGANILHNYVSPDRYPSPFNRGAKVPFVSGLYTKLVNPPPPGSPADGCCTCQR